MSTLPTGFAHLTLAFAPLFSKRVFQSVQVLLLFGAILAIGKRTATAVLRVMGLEQQLHFQTYHRALSRAAWSLLAASRILLRLLVCAFALHGPLVFGSDDTIERRWGARIAARGIHRDPVLTQSLRQGQRLTLAVDDVARSDFLGNTGLGAAFFHHLVVCRTSAPSHPRLE
jgi:hypothetical protein